MQRIHSSLFSLCLLLAFASVTLFVPAAVAQGRCAHLSATIIGSYDLAAGGWVGRAYMSLDGGAPVNAAILDQWDPESTHPTMATPSGNWSGNEVVTFTLDGVGSFQMRGHYTANAASSPFLWNFHETGKIDPVGSSGDFAGMTGQLSIQGLFTIGGGGEEYPPSETNPFVWIAEVSGSVCNAPEF